LATIESLFDCKRARPQARDDINDDANSHKPSKPRFDPTINYGHVLTALSIIVAGTGAYYGMSVELRVAKIEATLQQLANVVVYDGRDRTARRPA
jgi:hypothetical protein